MNANKSRNHSGVLPAASVPGLLRRRALTMASTAAALSLGGCGMLPSFGTTEKPVVIETDSRPVVLSKQQEVAKQTAEYAAAVESAKKPAPAAAPALADAHKAAPVILANSASSATPSEAVSPAATPAPAAESAKAPDAPKTAGSPTPASPAAPPAAPAALAPAPAPAAPSPISSSVNSATPVPSATITPIATPREPVVPAAMGSVVAMAATPATTANGAAPPAQETIGEPALAQALDVVRKQVSSKPSLASALALSLLDPNAGKATDANPAKDLSPADQKLLTDLLTALQAMPASTAGATVADRAAPLVAAAKKWEADADISLPKLVLASRVDSYGVYTAIDGKFESGQRHTVIIYCEVANFASKKTDDGWFQTRLSQQETLITEDGLLVWRPNAEEVEDRSMNQRRDFYLVKKLTIPENLAVGKYTLRMSVTDKNTNKIAMVTIPIEVVVK